MAFIRKAVLEKMRKDRKQVEEKDIQLANRIQTGLQYIYGMQVLERNCIAVIGGANGIYCLRLCSFSGETLFEEVLQRYPVGLANIVLNNQSCLTISYTKEGKIDFHDLSNPANKLATVACPKPGVLCAITPSVLAYVSEKDELRSINFFDCSGPNPIPHGRLQCVRTRLSAVWGMTFKEDGVRRFLVAVGHGHGHGKVCAYDILGDGKCRWECSGQLNRKHPGINPQDVTYNRQNDTFLVACLEGYVHEISSTDGKYVKTVLDESDKIKRACHLTWNTAMTHLILQHNADKEATISIFGRLSMYTDEMLQDIVKKVCAGTKQVYRVRLAVVGTYRVGKTSVVHNLLGQPFVAEHISTEGIDTHLAEKLRVRQVTCSSWKEIDKQSVEITSNDLQREVLLYIARNQNIFQAEENARLMQETPLDSPTDPRAEVVYARAEGEENAENGAPHNQDPDIDHEALTGIQAVLKSRSNSVPEDPEDEADAFRISIWDFGGQLQFYATHHMFLDPELVYMLVLDITQHLGTPVETEFMGRFDSKQVGVPKTVKDFIDYWLNSIHTYAKEHVDNLENKSTKCLPPVAIVLTHEDVIPEPNKAVYIQNFKRELQKHMDGKPYEPHVYKKIVVVDNINRNQKVTEELQEIIVKLASEQPGWGSLRSIKWLRFERTLHLESKDIDKSFLPMGRVRQLARDFHMDEDNFKEFASVYHALGDLLFFEGSGIVVTKPQWLIDSFSKVITAPRFHDKDEYEPFKEQIRRLDKEGVATMRLLHFLWENDLPFLLPLMTKFGLMIPFDEEGQHRGSSFYVPCLLPSLDLGEYVNLKPPWKKLAAGIFYISKARFLPIGLFQKVICRCSELENWSLHGDVAYNAASFRISGQAEVMIILTSQKCSIKLEAWSPSEEQNGLNLYEIRQKVEQCLHNVGARTEFAVNVCPCEGYADAEDVCFIHDEQIIANSKYAICSKHVRVLKPEDYRPWFQARVDEADGAENAVEPNSPEKGRNNEEFRQPQTRRKNKEYHQPREGDSPDTTANDDRVLREMSKGITDESILYDIGIQLGVDWDDITAIRTDYPSRIQESGLHLLRHWLQKFRDSPDTRSVSEVLRGAFQDLHIPVCRKYHDDETSKKMHKVPSANQNGKQEACARPYSFSRPASTTSSAVLPPSSSSTSEQSSASCTSEPSTANFTSEPPPASFTFGRPFSSSNSRPPTANFTFGQPSASSTSETPSSSSTSGTPCSANTPSSSPPADASAPSSASTNTTGHQQRDMALLRTLSKLITDEGKLQDIGIELKVPLNDIRRILTDTPRNIENAALKVLHKWYRSRQSQAAGSNSVLSELVPLFLQHSIRVDQVDLYQYQHFTS